MLPPYVDSNKATFGKGPPELIGVEDICPPQVICPTCSNPKVTKECKEEFSIDYLLDHQPLTIISVDGIQNKGLINRTLGKV